MSKYRHPKVPTDRDQSDLEQWADDPDDDRDDVDEEGSE